MRKHSKAILAALGVAIAIVLLYNAGSSVDWKSTAAVLRTLTPWNLVMILIPFVLLATLDSLGWRRLLPKEQRSASIWKIFRVRTSGEAFVMSFPMGAVLSEPLKILLFKRYMNIRASESTASVMLRSFILGMAQATLVVVATLMSFKFLEGVSQRIIGRSSLEYVLLFGGLLTLAFYSSLTLGTTYGSATEWVHKLLSGSRFNTLNTLSRRSEKYFNELGSQFATLGATRSVNLLISYAMYMGVWLIEACETYLILHLLGASITVSQAIEIEVICSYLRATAFFLPAGLGLEETLYLTMLTAVGVLHPVAAGFVIVKRLRELLWVGLGYTFMLTSGFKFKQLLSGSSSENVRETAAL